MCMCVHVRVCVQAYVHTSVQWGCLHHLELDFCLQFSVLPPGDNTAP